MKHFEKQAAQGDLLIRRVDSIPSDAKPMEADGDNYIMAHSETGHHHTLSRYDVQAFTATDMIGYVDVPESADLVHHRPFHTHETLRLRHGKYEIRRQREHTPEGFRRVLD